MVSLLLKKGADKTIKRRLASGSTEGETALEIAEGRGFYDIADLLR